MIHGESEVIINRSAEHIWSYAAEIERHTEWMTVSTAEALEGRGDRVGDRGRERTRIGPIVRDMEFTITVAEPGRRISWRADGDMPIVGDLTLELEAVGPTRTRVRYFGDFAGRGVMRWLEPLFAAEIRASPAKELARLKSAIEAEA